MNDLVTWGLEIVRWVQTFRNPLLDPIMGTTYYLGAEDFFILFLPLIFWCLHKRLGIRLSAVLLFSIYVNAFFKDLFAAPRPWQVDSKLYAPFKTEGFGMPSGHSQCAVTFWGYIAAQLKTRWWWALAIFMSLFIGIGRIYVGDHFPQDVLLGWTFGIGIVAAYAWLQPRVGQWLSQQSMTTQIALAIIVPLALVLIHWTSDTAKAAGVLIGMYAGLPIEEKYICFDERTTWVKQIIKFAIGAVIILALRFGLKAIFPEMVIFDLIRYTVMGLWAGVGAPWVFVKAQLAASSQPSIVKREQLANASE